jgi:hypothetical protein
MGDVEDVLACACFSIVRDAVLCDASYHSVQHAVALALASLENPMSEKIAARGRTEVSQIYTKSLQWSQFVELVARC